MAGKGQGVAVGKGGGVAVGKGGGMAVDKGGGVAALGMYMGVGVGHEEVGGGI